MIRRWLMSWFPRRTPPDVTHRLDVAVNEALLAGSEVERAADSLVAHSEVSSARVNKVSEDAGTRLARQEARRKAREKAVRDRGVAAAVEDLLKLPSFGGRDSHEDGSCS